MFENPLTPLDAARKALAGTDLDKVREAIAFHDARAAQGAATYAELAAEIQTQLRASYNSFEPDNQSETWHRLNLLNQRARLGVY